MKYQAIVNYLLSNPGMQASYVAYQLGVSTDLVERVAETAGARHLLGKVA